MISQTSNVRIAEESIISYVIVIDFVVVEDLQIATEKASSVCVYLIATKVAMARGFEVRNQ